MIKEEIYNKDASPERVINFGTLILMTCSTVKTHGYDKF